MMRLDASSGPPADLSATRPFVLSMTAMRPLFRLLIAAVFFVAGGADSRSLRADDPPRIRAVSYNIHYGQGNDGKYDIERLAKVIRRSQPDLVGLQEVDVGVERSGRVHQARRLGELTGMQVRYGPTQHYQGGLYGNAVLTSLPILDVHIQPLPYTEATPELLTYPRGAIAVTVRGTDGDPLRFISTHFQHNLPEDRLAQARAINNLFAGDDVPTILAGDMNALPEAEPIAELLKKWSNATDDPPAPTAPSQNPRSRIDYIFYRPGRAFRLVEASVVDEPIASDHRPVLAVLELNGQ
jgi:endonuclease/exonuclease/phosphatase family metal-dependent hydrolase